MPINLHYDFKKGISNADFKNKNKNKKTKKKKKKKKVNYVIIKWVIIIIYM